MADVEMQDAAASGPAKASKSMKAGGSEGASEEKKKFEVKKWNAVALWAWDIVVDNCAICRNHIMDLSCFPLSLHIKVVKDSPSVPPGQQRLGVPEVWAVEIKFDWNADGNNVADSKIYEDVLIFNSLHRRRRFLEYSSSLIISSGVEVTIYPFIGFLY
ncbi:hypothetical protein V8E54_009388 [Elaphomyces granulatus]